MRRTPPPPKDNKCVFVRGFRVKQTAKPKPEIDLEQEYIVERIGDSAEVRTLFLTLLPQILILMPSKHRDPLDLLSEYIAKVSTMNLCLFDSDHVNLSRNVQRAPSCDMVLVHDDDLE